MNDIVLPSYTIAPFPDAVSFVLPPLFSFTGPLFLGLDVTRTPPQPAS